MGDIPSRLRGVEGGAQFGDVHRPGHAPDDGCRTGDADRSRHDAGHEGPRVDDRADVGRIDRCGGLEPVVDDVRRRVGVVDAHAVDGGQGEMCPTLLRGMKRRVG